MGGRDGEIFSLDVQEVAHKIDSYAWRVTGKFYLKILIIFT